MPADQVLAAGLPATEVAAWRAARPAVGCPAAEEQPAAAAGRLAEFCRRGDRLLALLPGRRQRGAAEVVAAEVLARELRGARSRFLRAHIEPVYRALTGDYTTFVRVGELVDAAAVYYPGLVPDRAAIDRERRLPHADKDGIEIDQAVFLSHALAHPKAGLHLVQAMLRPTRQAEELLERFRSAAAIDLGPVQVTRQGAAGHVTLQNPAYLNAEDDSTVVPLEVAIDLVLLDPAIEVGVLRGATVEHPKYAGRRVFNAGINLTHLYQGRISYVDFYLQRDLGLVNKLYRGLAGPDFLPDEPEVTVEKPWIAAVEAFAIGGGCQLLLTVDHVLAERGAYFNLPARKEGIIPGAANLRLPRLVGARMARQGIMNELSFAAASPEGGLLCDEVVEPGAMDAAILRTIERLTSSGVVSAAANRRALRAGQEPIDLFRRYMALYARDQAECHFSPALIRNLERYWIGRDAGLRGDHRVD